MVHRDLWRSINAMDYAMPTIKSKPFCVGLTGGIGSGKTTVANLFAKLHISIIDADEIARQLTEKNAVVYHKIKNHFGKNILNVDESINRQKLRDIIFENVTEKKWLENCLHPLIRQTMRDEIQKIKSPYCICVIPLLAESTGIDFVDRVLVIDTPIENQIQRAKKRDNTTEAAIQKIIQSQANQAARLKIADDILINDGDLKSLEHKVKQLHVQYMR